MKRFVPAFSLAALLTACVSWTLLEDCAPHVRETYEKARAGDARAQYRLGECLQFGDGVPSADERGAVYWYEKAAAQGHVPARNNLANLHLRGGEDVRDESKGRALLETASTRGNGESVPAPEAQPE